MKIKRFKLNALSAEGLRQKEMNALLGGKACSCSCYYANSGGSQREDNMNANYAYGYTSVYGCDQTIKTDDWIKDWHLSHA